MLGGVAPSQAICSMSHVVAYVYVVCICCARQVPYFLEIYEKSGYPEMVKKHGESSSYQLAPRAQIFRR